MLADQIVCFSQLVQDAHTTAGRTPPADYGDAEVLSSVLQQLATSAQDVKLRWPCLCGAEALHSSVQRQTVLLEQPLGQGRVPHDLLLDVRQLALDSTRVKYRLASEQKPSWPEDLKNLPQGIVLIYAIQLLVPLIRLGIGMAKPPPEARRNRYNAPDLWRSHWQPPHYPAGQHQVMTALLLLQSSLTQTQRYNAVCERALAAALL